MRHHEVEELTGVLLEYESYFSSHQLVELVSRRVKKVDIARACFFDGSMLKCESEGSMQNQTSLSLILIEARIEIDSMTNHLHNNPKQDSVGHALPAVSLDRASDSLVSLPFDVGSRAWTRREKARPEFPPL